MGRVAIHWMHLVFFQDRSGSFNNLEPPTALAGTSWSNIKPLDKGGIWQL
jgi:hypothetical protein